ncbi:MAG: AzlD domain-containing protein [Sarcina sp.]
MYLIVCLLIMWIVTYIPRVLPLIINKQIESTYVKSVLYYMPYCVLGAMTFPSVFYSTSSLVFSLVGTGVAIFLAYKNQSLIRVAMASVVVIFILNIVF